MRCGRIPNSSFLFEWVFLVLENFRENLWPIIITRYCWMEYQTMGKGHRRRRQQKTIWMCRPKPNRFVMCGMPLHWKQARVRIILKNDCIIRLSGRSSYSSVNNVWWIRCWAKRMSEMTILMQHSKVFIAFTTLNGQSVGMFWTSSLVIFLCLPMYPPFL